MYLQSNIDDVPAIETAFNNAALVEDTGEIMSVPENVKSSLPSKYWGVVLIGLLVAFVTGLLQRKNKKSSFKF